MLGTKTQEMMQARVCVRARACALLRSKFIWRGNNLFVVIVVLSIP